MLLEKNKRNDPGQRGRWSVAVTSLCEHKESGYAYRVENAEGWKNCFEEAAKRTGMS